MTRWLVLPLTGPGGSRILKGTAWSAGRGVMARVHQLSMGGGRKNASPLGGGVGVLPQMRSTMWMRGALLVLMP